MACIVRPTAYQWLEKSEVSLHDWGFDARIASLYAEGETPARAIAVFSNLCRAVFEDGERQLFLDPSDPPATGDWIAASPERVLRVLPRRSAISRKHPGSAAREQVLAANADLLLVVSGLDHDLNPRRLERYLAMALSSGAEPVFLLNKIDLCAEPAAAIGSVRAVAAGYPVIVCGARDGVGIEAIRGLIEPGRTAAMVGSSGVGKSTLANAMLGETAMQTREVREYDSRGRHTTSHREMFLLPGGGVLLDQPGLREIQLWVDADSIEGVFPEVAERARSCRFRDCSHSGEPGCAVEGVVDAERLASYRKLTGETDALLRKRRDKQGGRALKQFIERHDKRR